MTGRNEGHCGMGRTSWTSALSVAAFVSLASTSSVLAGHFWPSRNRTDSDLLGPHDEHHKHPTLSSSEGHHARRILHGPVSSN
jgi:hypothetical protein